MASCLALASLTCASSLSPVALEVEITTTVTLQTPERTAEGVAGGLAVSGFIDVTIPCFDFDAEATVRADSLVFTLLAVEKNRACTQNAVRYAYEARISGVDPGEYQFVLVHDVTTAQVNFQDTIMQTDVSVP